MLIRLINSFFTAADTPRSTPPFHVRRNNGDILALTRTIQGERQSKPLESVDRGDGYLECRALAEISFIDDVENTAYHRMGHFPATHVVCSALYIDLKPRKPS